MAPFDLASGLPDLEPDAPAGPDLELDPAFGALERAAQGTPERQAGDKIVPAEDPVWKEVAEQAAALLERTYDLRVLAYLAVARLHVSGLGAFATVLAMVGDLLSTRWEYIHPRLDPEDGNDPALRANALLQLAQPVRVLRVLRGLTLATSQRAGVVSWRVIAAALGVIEADAAERQSESEIRAAFADTPAERIAVLRNDIAHALQAVARIADAFDRHSGYGNAPDLSGLSKLLQDIDRYVGSYHVAGAVAAEAADDTTPSAPTRAAEIAAGSVTAMALRSVGTRAEALHLLDVASRFFQTYEPSSPLPLMITRARRLADKSFLEILQDLAPDGLGQAQNIVQPREG